MYTVRQAADIVGVSPHTVRYYDKCGLLIGVSRDDLQGRCFDEAALEWLGVVVMLRASGMTVDEIGRFAELEREGPATAAERRAILQRQQKHLIAKARTLETHLQTITHLLQSP